MNADQVVTDEMVVEEQTVQETRPVQGTRVEPTPGWDGSKLIGVLAAVVLAALVLLGAWALSRPAPAPEQGVAPQPAHHDSGIDRLLRERDQAFKAHHDSGIDRLLREREQAGR